VLSTAVEYTAGRVLRDCNSETRVREPRAARRPGGPPAAGAAARGRGDARRASRRHALERRRSERRELDAWRSETSERRARSKATHERRHARSSATSARPRRGRRRVDGATHTGLRTGMRSRAAWKDVGEVVGVLIEPPVRAGLSSARRRRRRRDSMPYENGGRHGGGTWTLLRGSTREHSTGACAAGGMSVERSALHARARGGGRGRTRRRRRRRRDSKPNASDGRHGGGTRASPRRWTCCFSKPDDAAAGRR